MQIHIAMSNFMQTCYLDRKEHIHEFSWMPSGLLDSRERIFLMLNLRSKQGMMDIVLRTSLLNYLLYMLDLSMWFYISLKEDHHKDFIS